MSNVETESGPPMSDLTKQAEETMWAETEARNSWEHLAAAIRAAKAAGVAEGIERAAGAVRVMAANARENDAIAAKARGDKVHISVASNVLEFAAIHITSLLPAEQRPAKNGETR